MQPERGIFCAHRTARTPQCKALRAMEQQISNMVCKSTRGNAFEDEMHRNIITEPVHCKHVGAMALKLASRHCQCPHSVRHRLPIAMCRICDDKGFHHRDRQLRLHNALNLHYCPSTLPLQATAPAHPKRSVQVLSVALDGGMVRHTAILVIVLASALIDASNCARQCHEIDCDKASIRYGKFCGIGHGGCLDDCVEATGMLAANGCHAAFIKCLNKQQRSGKQGFSTMCPYDLVIPTMRQGIELAMQFTSLRHITITPQAVLQKHLAASLWRFGGVGRC
ncbi:uncharacterized protein HaLaN_02521 [Haematococcus lacustris]|uniref:Uncharacterized protein n=1 Tax=Haematococcus lacustris TaxID=44745 RepID=A0A699YII0_HAELA|nr:uncharacterized protein HaLaN_02521 [Haematococcus lacustris]